MPCFSVAVVSAKLNAKFSVELLTQESARAALGAFIKGLLGAEVTIKVNEKSVVYQLNQIDTTVTLNESGISMRSYNRQYSSQKNIDEITKMAEALALASVKERMISRIKSKYLVKSDVQVDGARMLQISI